jgi:hypothetical protein
MILADPTRVDNFGVSAAPRTTVTDPAATISQIAVAESSRVHRLNEHDVRGADQRHQRAADAGADHLPGGADRLHCGVAGQHLMPADHRGQVALVPHIEEDPGEAGQQRHRHQVRDGQEPQHGAERDGGQQHAAHQIARDEDRPPAPPVEPCAGRQPDDRERERPGCRHEPEFERRSIQSQHRQQRDRDTADLRAELARGLPEQQQAEIVLGEQRHGPMSGPVLLLRRRLRERDQRRDQQNSIDHDHGEQAGDEKGSHTLSIA